LSRRRKLGFALVVPLGRYHLPLLPLAAVFAAALALAVPPKVIVTGWQAARAARPAGAAALLAACVVAAASAVSNATIDYDVQASESLVAALGETVTLGDLEITARGVSMTASDPALGPAPPGQLWVVVDAVLRNTGGAPIVLLGPAQVTVEDALRNSYTLAPAEEGPLTSDIGAGQAVETPAVFAVPVDAAGLQFVFRAIGVAPEGRWALE
jgi:hypothetical protein